MFFFRYYNIHPLRLKYAKFHRKCNNLQLSQNTGTHTFNLKLMFQFHYAECLLYMLVWILSFLCVIVMPLLLTCWFAFFIPKNGIIASITKTCHTYSTFNHNHIGVERKKSRKKHTHATTILGRRRHHMFSVYFEWISLSFSILFFPVLFTVFISVFVRFLMILSSTALCCHRYCFSYLIAVSAYGI